MRRWWIFVMALVACDEPDPDFRCSDDASCTQGGITGRCELEGFCTFEDTECAGGRRFSEHSAELSNVCVTIVSACRVPIAAELAWELEIPASANFKEQADVPYTTDRREELKTVPFSRVAYCLELDAELAYVELDDFTAGVIAETGIPTENVHDVPITNLTVRSTIVSEVVGGVGAIEMWPNCYGPGDSGVYDTDDDVTAAGPTDHDCYGSFQVHHESTIVFAYNHWSNNASSNDDLGIGNSPQGNLDYTFEENAGIYDRRFLQAFIVP